MDAAMQLSRGLRANPVEQLLAAAVAAVVRTKIRASETGTSSDAKQQCRRRLASNKKHWVVDFQTQLVRWQTQILVNLIC